MTKGFGPRLPRKPRRRGQPREPPARSNSCSRPTRPQWQGDLGAFLRDKLTDTIKHARVRVHGSGQRRSSPSGCGTGWFWKSTCSPGEPRVGMALLAAGAESHGRSLFELHGGTLLLSQVRLRADESAAGRFADRRRGWRSHPASLPVRCSRGDGGPDAPCSLPSRPPSTRAPFPDLPITACS